MNFLIAFHAKPDSDACGRQLLREHWSIADYSKTFTPVTSWEEVEDAASDYVDRHYGDHLQGPKLDCWVWEEGKVADARELRVCIERAISVTASFA